jgi:uncharacterized coiled-coil protein SlyX
MDKDAIIAEQQARIIELESDSAMQIIVDQLEGQVAALSRRNQKLSDVLISLIGE